MKSISIAVVVLLAASGAWYATRGSDQSTHSEIEGAQTVLVSRRDVGSTVLATGVVRPMVGAEVRVGSRVSGVLERLYVTVGDRECSCSLDFFLAFLRF